MGPPRGHLPCEARSRPLRARGGPEGGRDTSEGKKREPVTLYATGPPRVGPPLTPPWSVCPPGLSRPVSRFPIHRIVTRHAPRHLSPRRIHGPTGRTDHEPTREFPSAIAGRAFLERVAAQVGDDVALVGYACGCTHGLPPLVFCDSKWRPSRRFGSCHPTAGLTRYLASSLATPLWVVATNPWPALRGSRGGV
jgi:hypothetical protein